MQNEMKRQLRLQSQENSSMPDLNLRVVYQRIDALKLDPVNPRVHSKKQIRKLKKSMKKFGFNVPVLVDAEFNVIAGHGRLLAGSRFQPRAHRL
jgi:hypothetical protein